jgi:hypothetical protein
VTNRRLRPLLQAGFTVLLLATLYLLRSRSSASDRDAVPTTAPSLPPLGGTVAEAFRTHSSNVEVETGGRVLRVLPDDQEGSRHQRFVVRMAGGISVLVAHNVDLAPRVPVTPGDSVELRGEYEWNDRGGVIHWTHHDPDGSREGGWVRHAGRLYQ